MPNIGLTEIVVIAGLALILFGSQRIPEAARGLGQALNAFKSGLKGLGDDKTSD